MTFAQFQQFLPNGPGLHRLRHGMRTYVGPKFDFDVQVLLRRNEVPAATLGGKKSHLGWDMWTRTRDFIIDADDAVFAEDGQNNPSASVGA